MPSNSGSPEPQPDLEEKLAEAEAMVGAIYDLPLEPLEERALRRPRAVSMTEFKEAVRKTMGGAEFNPGPDTEMYALMQDERDRIADGEPYCFKCGRPASSFEAYDCYMGEEEDAPGSRADAVRHEEGTYNPATNRFACDACYIAIGTPAAPGGWKAP